MVLEDQLGLACWSSLQSNPAFHINKLFTQVVNHKNGWISGFSIRCHDSTDGSISSTTHPCSVNERGSQMCLSCFGQPVQLDSAQHKLESTPFLLILTFIAQGAN